MFQRSTLWVDALCFQETKNLMMKSGAKGGDILMIVGDLRKEEVQNKLITSTVDNFGGIDILASYAELPATSCYTLRLQMEPWIILGEQRRWHRNGQLQGTGIQKGNGWIRLHPWPQHSHVCSLPCTGYPKNFHRLGGRAIHTSFAATTRHGLF